MAYAEIWTGEHFIVETKLWGDVQFVFSRDQVFLAAASKALMELDRQPLRPTHVPAPTETKPFGGHMPKLSEELEAKFEQWLKERQ